MFQIYQSLPSEIEAVQFTEENKDRVFNSLVGQYAADFEEGSPVLKVMTIHGDVAIVRIGDWIAKDKEPGTYYPIKDEVMQDKYA